MDRMTPGDRGGVVVAPLGRPVPSRRRLLLATVPADGLFLVAALSTAWWAEDRGGLQRFVPGWVAAFALAWLVLVLTRARRPVMRRRSQHRDVHAARRRALRTGRLPESPSVRIGAAARSCDQLEATFLLLVVGATTGLGLLLWPELPWPVPALGWALLTVPSLGGAVRGWAYLRLYEAGDHGRST